MGLTLLDDKDDVIRPALIWCDQRSQEQVDFIDREIGREKVLSFTANPVVTGFTLPKLLWVRDNEPQNFERVRKVLLPKDYVRLKLTGEYATEVSDASGTSLFDVVKRTWSYPLVDALGLDRSILPRCYESIEVSGRLTTGGGSIYRVEIGHSRCRRRRRSGRERHWQRNRPLGCGFLHTWHVGCGVRAHGPAAL